MCSSTRFAGIRETAVAMFSYTLLHHGTTKKTTNNNKFNFGSHFNRSKSEYIRLRWLVWQFLVCEGSNLVIFLLFLVTLRMRIFESKSDVFMNSMSSNFNRQMDFEGLLLFIFNFQWNKSWLLFVLSIHYFQIFSRTWFFGFKIPVCLSPTGLNVWIVWNIIAWTCSQWMNQMFFVTSFEFQYFQFFLWFSILLSNEAFSWLKSRYVRCLLCVYVASYRMCTLSGRFIQSKEHS